MKSLIIFLVAQ